MEEEVLSARLQALREQLYEWNTLVNNPGWKLLKKLLQAQLDHRLGSIIRKPTAELVDLAVREYERGEAAGLDLAINLCGTETERLKAEIELVLSRITIEENADENSIPAQPDSAP